MHYNQMDYANFDPFLRVGMSIGQKMAYHKHAFLFHCFPVPVSDLAEGDGVCATIIFAVPRL